MIVPYRAFGYWPKVRSKRDHWNWLDENHVKLLDGVNGGHHETNGIIELHNGNLLVTATTGLQCVDLIAGHATSLHDRSLHVDANLVTARSPVTSFQKTVASSKYPASVRITHVSDLTSSIDTDESDVFFITATTSSSRCRFQPPNSSYPTHQNGRVIRVVGDGGAPTMSVQFYDTNTLSYVTRFTTSTFGSSTSGRWWAEACWLQNAWRLSAWGGDFTSAVTP